MPERPPEPQLYLVAPPVVEAGAIRAALDAALAGPRPVAALLLRLAPADERAHVNIVKDIAAFVQAKGVAILVEDDLAAATRGGADGVHVTAGIGAIRAAIERLAPGRIVGAGNLKSRHDAMEAGEAGVDYVMFGEPVGGRPAPPLRSVADRATWWAEVFQIPGVAWAPDREAERLLAATGIDFIARPLA